MCHYKTHAFFRLVYTQTGKEYFLWFVTGISRVTRPKSETIPSRKLASINKKARKIP